MASPADKEGAKGSFTEDKTTNSGELTFEEGAENRCYSPLTLTHFYIWQMLPEEWDDISEYSAVRWWCTFYQHTLQPIQMVLYQRWSHNWDRYLFHTIVDSLLGSLRWCLSHALGSRLPAILLRSLRLVRIWYYVSSFRRREGIHGGGV